MSRVKVVEEGRRGSERCKQEREGERDRTREVQVGGTCKSDRKSNPQKRRTIQREREREREREKEKKRERELERKSLRRERETAR
jgi:hypothetical protein